MMAVVPSMQLCAEAAFSNCGPQYQSSPSRALNANVGPPRPHLIQTSPNASAGIRGSPTVRNLLQIRGYDLRSQFSLRGGLRPEPGMHSGLLYPHYGVPAVAKQPKKFQVEVRSEKFTTRVKEKVKNYLKPNRIAPEEQIDQPADSEDDLNRLELRFGIAKQAFREGLENSFPKYMEAVLFIPKRYVMRKIRRMQDKNEADAILGYVIKSGVKVAVVVLSKMREVVLDVTKHIPEVQIEDLLKVETGLVSPRPLESCSEPPHAKPRIMTALPDQAHQVSKEKLAPGTRAIFRDTHGLFRDGLWDGDVLIHDVSHCTCSDCTAAAAFNSEYSPRFTKGDHLYAECEPNMVTREPMFHQGIYDGAGHVYHFATSHAEVDQAYEKCAECGARGAQRRRNLVSRNLGPSGVRKSCLFCFAEKACMDSRRANIETYIARIGYGENFKTWKMASTDVPLSPIVCMAARRGGEEVVEDARRFYDDDSFGRYSEEQGGMSHNCESFAYLCKTGIYESHQVTEALFQRLVFDEEMSETEKFLFLLGAKAFLFVRGVQKVATARMKAAKANKERPMLVPAVALVPDEMWVVT